MIRKTITAAVIAAFTTIVTADQWDGLIKMFMAAVIFWWMTLLLLIGMEEKKDVEDYQRKSETPQRKHRDE